ncbi:MAG: hypothetical protein RR743_01840 [Oscillospiraceae bacterium]
MAPGLRASPKAKLSNRNGRMDVAATAALKVRLAGSEFRQALNPIIFVRQTRQLAMSDKNSFARQKDDWTGDEGRFAPRGRGDGRGNEGTGEF